MKIKCDYCGNYMDETAKNCPNCGGINRHLKQRSDGTPQTIEELQRWYREHNLPPEEVTRFFIGKDYRGARAFGIYRDGNEVVVYKNKDNGERAIRYQGTDEAYGVNEIYLKLKERIAEEKAKNTGRNASGHRQDPVRKKSRIKRILFMALLPQIIILVSCLIMALVLFFSSYFRPSRGYYNYGGDTYYYLGSSWYIYDGDSWERTTAEEDLSRNYKTYYDTEIYEEDSAYTDFEDTSYYQSWYDDHDSYDSYNHDWDSDSNWDSYDSWDSGGGDWGSDW